MTAKEFLRQVRFVDRMIDSKLRQVERLRDEAGRTTLLLSDMPRGSGSRNHLEDVITKIVDLENEINRDIDRLVDLKTAARTAINAIQEPEYRLILELRYLCYKTWPEIAETMGYCESNIYRLHGFALNSFVVPQSAAQSLE